MSPFDSGAYVTDGGLETDLIFHHGVDLPDFASFPLVGTTSAAASCSPATTTATPTWPAGPAPGWCSRRRPGGPTRTGRRASATTPPPWTGPTATSIGLVSRIRDSHADLHDAGVVVSGAIGPRGDGYVADDVGTAEDYAAYHEPQVASFHAAGADVATAMTMTHVDEAVGVVAAARSVGIPVVVMFTVETDGRLPDGTALSDAVEQTDAAGGPDWFGVNCAHPDHLAPGLTDGRLARPPARRPPQRLPPVARRARRGGGARRRRPGRAAPDLDALRDRLPGLRVVGGCCGTDVRHVASLWGVPASG